VYGESPEFKIEARSITVTKPTSTTIWSQGTPGDITWTSTGSITNVKIDLYKGTALSQTIIVSTSNNGSYTWTSVPTSLADGSDYKIRVSSVSDSSVNGESPAFKIEARSITVTKPTSTTIWITKLSADITWTSKGAISDVKIDLYKGTALNQTIVASTPNSGSYTWTSVPTSLVDGTDYKVRVSSVSDSSVYGESAAFKIEVKFITVTKPLSSTIWTQGDSVDITWTSQGTISNVKIDLYKGNTLNLAIVASTPNSGSYTWTSVPTSLEDGSDYQIRVSSASDSSVYGESPEFKIEARSITVTKPTSTTIWSQGSPGDITWTSTGAISNVKIDLYKGTTLIETIVASTDNDGSYTWTSVPTSLADGSDYKVRVSSATDSGLYDESDSFKVSTKSITITNPASTTIWSQGDSANITWTSTGAITNIKIDLYKGTTLNQTIIASTANNGSYTWTTVPTSLADGSDYKIRVSNVDDSSIYGESEAFKIEKKSITVAEPKSTTTWAKGYSADINWTTTGAISNVKIDLYKGTTLNQTIVASTDNSGPYTWATVPTSLADGTDYKVRITSGDSSVYGESAAFKIAASSITVTKPISTTIWSQGDSVDINWTSQGTVSNVKVDLYKGTTLNQTIVASTTNSGSYNWTTVSTSLADGSDYKIRVSNVADSSVYGESDAFKIEARSITVTKPASGTIWTIGRSGDIAWTSKGNINNVKIDLYKGGAFNQLINASTENDGSYTWDVIDPSLLDGSTYSIKVSYASDSNVYGDSPLFRIEEKSITVTSPAANSYWTKSASTNITWNYKGTMSYMKIELYKGGAFKQTIIASTSNSGSYSWTVATSLANGSDYKIRISYTTDPSIYAESAEFNVTYGYTYATKIGGTSGSGEGQFSYPRGVAVDSSGNVYVADTNNNRIQKLSPNLNYLTNWGNSGSGDGQFSGPYGVAVDSSGNVYVADSGNDRIQKFTSDGMFVKKWGAYGSGDGQFNDPRGVAVDSSGNVYVADYYNYRIQKFTSDGTFVAKWGSYGSGDGQFYYPAGVAVDSSGNVYVADYYNDRIQKFTSTGTFVTKWGSSGSGNGQFDYVAGVAVDSSDNVFVSDYWNDRIQKFTSDGMFITKWGSWGTGDGQFEYLYGVAADSSGNIFVADSNNHRIQKFEPIYNFSLMTTDNSMILKNNFSLDKKSIQKSFNMESPPQNRPGQQKKNKKKTEIE